MRRRKGAADEQVTARIRRPGGGRKQRIETDPKLMEALESLVDPVTRGDPMSPLRWTGKSTYKLSEESHRQKHPVGPRTVAVLLRHAGYRLQANRKTREGRQHPDRNAQFQYINAQVAIFQKRRKLTISVDTKKKELVGDFANGGQEWQQGLSVRAALDANHYEIRFCCRLWYSNGDATIERNEATDSSGA